MIEKIHQYLKDADAAIDKGQYDDAIVLLLQVVKLNPNHEHGEILFQLAGCYEDSEQTDKAEEYYLKALEIAPQNTYFLGGYASFLYLFREPQIAFDWYLKPLKAENDNSDSVAMERTKLGLFALAEKLGWSKEDVDKKIEIYLS